MLNIAVLAPMPNARSRTTVAANPGLRPRPRAAWRRSRPRSSSQRQLQTSRVRSRISAALPRGPARRPLSFVLRATGVPLSLALQLKMESDLLLYVGIGLTATQVGQEPTQPDRPRHHVPPSASAGCMTRPTAATIRSQRVASRTSCRRPERVKA